MLQRQPKSTHTVTLVPYTQLSRIGTILALPRLHHGQIELRESHLLHPQSQGSPASVVPRCGGVGVAMPHKDAHGLLRPPRLPCGCPPALPELLGRTARSEEHTSESQSLNRHSDAVLCFKNKK